MPAQSIPPEILPGQTMSLRIEYRARRNARRYILRPNDAGDGGCVTIPRGGSRAEARHFARRNLPWLEERLQRRREKTGASLEKNRLLFRGETFTPATEPADEIVLGQEIIALGAGTESWREKLKLAFWRIAARELPGRVGELAAEHQLQVKRVSVRNQRSRWGSCSVKGVISLNWRLIQTPPFVRDYIIIHELMHLREMNHSSRFWKNVREAFPRADEAERWLKSHAWLLRE